MSKLISSLHNLPAGSTYQNRSHVDQKVDVVVKFKNNENHQPNQDAMLAFAHLANQHGVAPTLINPNTSSVHLTGTVGSLEHFFGVELNEYSRKEGGTFRHYDNHLNLPNDFDHEVIAVLGLSTGFRAKSHHRVLAKPNDSASSSYYPEQVAKLYNFPEGDGTGQTVAILELGGGYVLDDLKTYAMGRNLPLPNVTAISVDGAVNVPGQDPNGADGEVMLDVEIVASVVPKAKILVYFSQNTAVGFDQLLSFAVNDQVNQPKIISISWGGPESSYAQQDLDSMNQTLEKAVSLNINVYVASGDNGSTDGTNSNVTDFPASSPFSIATGGTYIQTVENNVITSEVAWGNNDNPGDGASGGGYSKVFAEPTYQNGIVKENSNFVQEVIEEVEDLLKKHKPTSNVSGRGVPDLSSNGDPQSGFNILVDGEQMVVAGTSAASPLHAGLNALLNQNLGKNAGWLNPVFYKNPDIFEQITSGYNGGYNAGPGWNAVCGNGRVDGTKLLAVLKA